MEHVIPFEQLVAEALERVPEHFRERLRNVAIVIEDAPTPAQLRSCGMDDDETMYGYYEGVAQLDRAIDEPMLPDRIVLFQAVLERDFGSDPATLGREIARTVYHEIAHHFGIDDDRLDALGRY
ncbi:MAG: metallopeptidase family protein [bacterium]|nr:metallopeptidase family protein [bacterium]